MSRIPTNTVSSRARQATYRDRRQAGLVPAALPWRWLTQADVQRLAAEAYRIATHDFSDVQDPQCTPEAFARGLQGVFETLVADAASAAGVPDMPGNASHYARCMRADLPVDWKPQYPVFIPAHA